LDNATENTYLGLLQQAFIGSFELDIYGFISLTNVKFLIFKIEQRLNPVKVNASERHIRQIFDNLHKLHTRMLLNPFFDLSWAKDGSALAIHEMSAHLGLDDDYDDEQSSGSGSNSSRSS
jgi:Sedlin, N-terminal conserved region